MSASTLKIAVLALLASLPTSVSATLIDDADAGLVVTGTVITKKCLTHDKNNADLHLRFTFTNALQQPLILNKSDIEIERIKYFAFIDEKTDKVHLGELAVDRLRGYVPEHDCEIVGMRPNNHFVILRPRQSYVWETTESVPLIPASAGNALSAPDEYQVEFELATWVFHDPQLADALGGRWGRFGVLWSDTVWSQPVKFVFPRNRTCQS